MCIAALNVKDGNSSMMDFSGKVILVSGSASGIGKGCAEILLSNGATVVGIDRTDGTIEHDKYRHFVTDISNEQSVTNVLSQIDGLYVKIDGLANCAGTFASSKPFYELDIEDWNRVINTNLTGLFLLTKHTTKRMIKNKSGKIVNISCIRSKIFRPNMADYAASKGGVVALTSSMALDLKEYGINVNSVAPGFTYTGMTKKSYDNPEVRTNKESTIPIGRIAKPEDIANVVMFLLSDMSNYINGETIFVDGGFKIEK